MTARRDVHRTREELEELFADLWQAGFAGLSRGLRPHVDCYRTDDPPAITIVLDLAGIDPEQVEILVTENSFLIRGERRRQVPSCRVSYRQMEIEYGHFQRRVSLSDPVDPDRAHASYEDGLLTVVMPLVETPRTGKVSIVLGGER